MNNKDLVQLLEKIYEKLSKEITYAYHNDNLDEVLKKYELEDEENEIEHFYYDTNRSKIIVIGGSRIDKNEMEYIAKHNGIDPRRIEFVLEFNKLTNYDFNKFKYNMSYSDILIGPIPHKVKGLDGSSSFLAMVKEDPKSFPNVIDLRNSHELKITKQSFLNGLLKTRLHNEIYR